MVDDLKIIKKKYGEKMMHLCRESFPSLLEYPGLLSKIMLEHFAENKFLYNDLMDFDGWQIGGFINLIYYFVKSEPDVLIATNKSPYELLDEAGYVLYECKTEKDIQSFKKYYAPGEELCTFNGGRLQTCHVFFAIKKDVDKIKRKDFSNPKREDEYGTSVISIQFRKTSPNTLSIKNRYNHKVSNPDSTFNNNLDNIIPGLTESFCRTYNYSFDVTTSNFDMPGYVCVDQKFYKYNQEKNNIYYCHNNIIIDNFSVIDKYSKEPERYIFLNYFIVDLHSKTIELYDKSLSDGFVEQFKNISKMYVSKDMQSGNKILKIVYDDNKRAKITFDNGKIIGYSDHFLSEMKPNFFSDIPSLVNIDVPNLKKMNNGCLMKVNNLEFLDAPELLDMGDDCLSFAFRLSKINVSKLKEIGNSSFEQIPTLSEFNAPSLVDIGDWCFEYSLHLKTFNTPHLLRVGKNFMNDVLGLYSFFAPKLDGDSVKCLSYDDRCLKDHLFAKCSSLCIYVDSKNKIIKFNGKPNRFDMEDFVVIKKIKITSKMLLEILNYIISNNLYKIKSKTFVNDKGGYKK